MFRAFFDSENPVMRALSIAADLLLLNALTLLFSLPLVTAGAAYTALNDHCWHLIRGEESTHIFRSWWDSFRSNLRKGSLLGILCMLAAFVLYIDGLVAMSVFPPLRFGVFAIALYLLAIAIYAFALLSRYEESFRVTLRKAAALTVGYFPRTLGMLLSVLGFWGLILQFYSFLLPLALLFGFSLPCYLCALLYDGVFHAMEGTEKQPGAEAEDEALDDDSQRLETIAYLKEMRNLDTWNKT